MSAARSQNRVRLTLLSSTVCPAQRLTNPVIGIFSVDSIPRWGWIGGRMNGLRAEPGNFRRGGYPRSGKCGNTSLPGVLSTPSRRRRWPSSDQDCSPLTWCLLVILSASPAFAQGQTAIAGVVRDTTGAVLPGVTVEASSSGTDRKGPDGH